MYVCAECYSGSRLFILPDGYVFMCRSNEGPNSSVNISADRFLKVFLVFFFLS